MLPSRQKTFTCGHESMCSATLRSQMSDRPCNCVRHDELPRCSKSRIGRITHRRQGEHLDGDITGFRYSMDGPDIKGTGIVVWGTACDVACREESKVEVKKDPKPCSVLKKKFWKTNFQNYQHFLEGTFFSQTPVSFPSTASPRCVFVFKARLQRLQHRYVCYTWCAAILPLVMDLELRET